MAAKMMDNKKEYHEYARGSSFFINDKQSVNQSENLQKLKQKEQMSHIYENATACQFVKPTFDTFHEKCFKKLNEMLFGLLFQQQQKYILQTERT